MRREKNNTQIMIKTLLFPGAPIDLNRYKPDNVEDIIPFDFISKSIYSTSHSNPKRRIEVPLREALDDVIREVSRLESISFYFSKFLPEMKAHIKLLMTEVCMT